MLYLHEISLLGQCRVATFLVGPFSWSVFNLTWLLLRIIEEIGFKAAEHSPTLISVLVTFLRDSDVTVIKQSIVSGTNIFCSCFGEMIGQVLSLPTLPHSRQTEVFFFFKSQFFLMRISLFTRILLDEYLIAFCKSWSWWLSSVFISFFFFMDFSPSLLFFAHLLVNKGVH